MTLVSIVVPCHRQAHFLPDAVRSLSRQTYRELEVVFVCGDDESAEIAEALLIRLPFPTKIIRRATYGGADAINRGVAAAQGKYICRLDADDMFHPTAVQRMLDATPMAELTITSPNLQQFDADWLPLPDSWRPGAYSSVGIRHTNCLLTCSLFTKKLWEVAGGLPEELIGFDDWAFWIAASAHSPVVTQIPQRLLLYRRHEGQWTNFGEKYRHILEAMIRLINPEIYGGGSKLRDTAAVATAPPEVADRIRQHAEWFPKNPNAQMFKALLP